MKKQIEIRVPESLNDITIKQFVDYLTLHEPNERDIIKCFYGLTNSDLFELDAKTGNYLLSQVKECLNEEPKLVRRFKLDGVLYGFIPNLDEMTYGEKLDLDEYINEPSQLARLAAVLFRPIIEINEREQYLIEKYEGSEKHYKKLLNAPVGIVLGAKVFFYHLMKDLAKAIPDYLEKIMQQESKTGLPNSTESLISYTSSQMKILEKQMKLPNYPYMKHFTGSNS